MQKIGMGRSPEDTFDHANLSINHPLQKYILYRLQKTEWLEHHEFPEIS